MDPGADFYFLRPAAAYVRGMLRERLPADLRDPPLDALADAQLTVLVEHARQADLRLHRFKRTMGLARVQRVIGALRSISPESLVDVGTGRGAFLWPLLDAFPWLNVLCIDLLEHRVRGLQAVHDGGMANVLAARMDLARGGLADRAADVVTLLEVLEHIPDPAAALRNAVRAARRFVVLSVPAHEDDNPEHIHLFNRQTLERLLMEAGAARVSFDSVHNHLLAIAKVPS